MKFLAFFNNKGGVGKTTLVYHLAWMFHEIGHNVIVADLDPQANLTSMFLDEDELEELWPEDEVHDTILGAVLPLIEGTGDVQPPYVRSMTPRLGLICGDLGLAGIEDDLSREWPGCLDRKARAFRVVTCLYRAIALAAIERGADIVLIDVGPNLGAINRSALISADYVVVPLAPDLFSLQGLRNLGPSLRRWRNEWNERKAKVPDPKLPIPNGTMQPLGYVLMQHAVRRDRPVQAYDRWFARIPNEYNDSVLGRHITQKYMKGSDTNCLALLKHYRSLMSMAMEAHKPMFFLKAADGAIGAHSQAVSSCYADFEDLAHEISDRCDL